MSYCVNCGVKLAESEKRCPLCLIPVQNPRSLYDASAAKPYPPGEDRHTLLRKRRSAAVVVTLLLLLASAVCIAVNLIYSEAFTWSLYPSGASALVWTVVVPLIFVNAGKFKNVVICVVLDFIALAGFLKLCEVLTGGDWFISVAMPVMAIALGGFLLNAALVLPRILPSRYYLSSAVTLTVCLSLLGVEAVVDLYVNGAADLNWSLYLLIPGLVLAVILSIFARNRKIKDELRKRLHL